MACLARETEQQGRRGNSVFILASPHIMAYHFYLTRWNSPGFPWKGLCEGSLPKRLHLLDRVRRTDNVANVSFLTSLAAKYILHTFVIKPHCVHITFIAI